MRAVFHTSVSLVIVIAALVCGAPYAQGWKPSKPVAFIVGASAGGSLDLTARALQQIWDVHKSVGKPIVVVNKPGVGNALAAAVKTDEWRKEIERNFWAANFLTGDKARQFMRNEDQKFRAIWKEIGPTQ